MTVSLPQRPSHPSCRPQYLLHKGGSDSRWRGIVSFKGRARPRGNKLVKISFCSPGPHSARSWCEGRVPWRGCSRRNVEVCHVMPWWALAEERKPGCIARQQQLAWYSNPGISLRLSSLGSCLSVHQVSSMLLLFLPKVVSILIT